MHDLDRTQLEFESDIDELESDRYEVDSDLHGEAQVFNEADEMELAAELIAISDESELAQFIGKIMGQAEEATGKSIKGGIGAKLGGLLKGVARKVLPTAAGAVGTLFGGPVVGRLASKFAGAAGKAFGLELEGLSTEDKEFEAARHFVRFAGEATKQAAKGAERGRGDAEGVAKQAAIAAAKKFAPGLLRRATDAQQSDDMKEPSDASGRWVRQGHKIVLLGV